MRAATKTVARAKVAVVTAKTAGPRSGKPAGGRFPGADMVRPRAGRRVFVLSAVVSRRISRFPGLRGGVVVVVDGASLPRHVSTWSGRRRADKARCLVRASTDMQEHPSRSSGHKEEEDPCCWPARQEKAGMEPAGGGGGEATCMTYETGATAAAPAAPAAPAACPGALWRAVPSDV